MGYRGCGVRCPGITAARSAWRMVAIPVSTPLSFAGLENKDPVKRHVTVIIPNITDRKCARKCLLVFGTASHHRNRLHWESLFPDLVECPISRHRTQLPRKRAANAQLIFNMNVYGFLFHCTPPIPLGPI